MNAKLIRAKKARRSAKASPEPVDEHAEVEKLAYRFFEERGRAHGFDQEDWFRAQAVVQSRRKS